MNLNLAEHFKNLVSFFAPKINVLDNLKSAIISNNESIKNTIKIKIVVISAMFLWQYNGRIEP